MTPRSRVSAFAVTTLVLLACVTVAGCDNSNDTPTAPSGSLQVTATRPVLRAGETAPLTVLSAGAPVSTVSWTSTDSTVVTVSPTGQATAGRAGRATVTASTGSASGSVALRVVPDYDGTWTGGLGRLQLTCSAASASAICAPGAATGGTLTLRVTQVGDQLTGTLLDSAEPAAVVPLAGQVLADDQLSLAGRLDTPATAPTTRVEIGTLRAALDVALGTINGSYTLTVERARTGTALQEDYRSQVQFRDVRRQ